MHSAFRVPASALLLFLGGVFPMSSRAQDAYLYWVASGGTMIQRASLEDHQVEDVITQSAEHVYIADVTVDPVDHRMYWTSGSGTIAGASLTGTEIDTLFEVPFLSGSLSAIAVDPSDRRLYWGKMTDFAEEVMQRLSLDGGEVENLAVSYFYANDLAIDTLADKIYWTSAALARNILRADLDGSNPETFEIGSGPIDLDLKTGYLYWRKTDAPTVLRRSRLDSLAEDLDDEIVLTAPDTIWAITLDAEGGHVYWTDDNLSSIWRAKLDGTEIEEVITGLDRVIRLAFADLAGSVSRRAVLHAYNPWSS